MLKISKKNDKDKLNIALDALEKLEIIKKNDKNEFINIKNENHINSFSFGCDIETGGHVFQLFLSNSTAMFERGFINENVENWSDGGIHFGFNISRSFNF